MLAKGRIRAQGTSLELKNAYGLGYHLHVVKGPGFERESAEALVRRHVKRYLLFLPVHCTVYCKKSRKQWKKVGFKDKDSIPTYLR